eukprot:sb/3478110/
MILSPKTAYILVLSKSRSLPIIGYACSAYLRLKSKATPYTEVLNLQSGDLTPLQPILASSTVARDVDLTQASMWPIWGPALYVLGSHVQLICRDNCLITINMT